MDTLATYDALDEGIAALQIRAEQTDTASPEGSRIRAAITTLEMVRDQRGCEHVDQAVANGRLTSVIDLVVFG